MTLSLQPVPNYQEAALPFKLWEPRESEEEQSDFEKVLLPVEQRLSAVGEAITTADPAGYDVGEVATGALVELCDFYQRHPEEALYFTASVGTYLIGRTVLEEQEHGFGASSDFQLSTAKTALGYLRALAVAAPSAGELIGWRPESSDFARRIAALPIGLRIDFVNNSIGLSTISRTKPANHGWTARVEQANTRLFVLTASGLEKPLERGFMTVSRMVSICVTAAVDARKDVLLGKFEHAVDQIETPRERRAPQRPKKAQPVVRERVIDDSQADQLISQLGIVPLSGKALKNHPIGHVLKSGGAVTLGQRYEFGGFGDLAGMAAGLIEKMSSATADRVDQILEQLAEQIALARETLNLQCLSPDARHRLKSLLDVVSKCTTDEFCQVAANTKIPTDPNVRTAVANLRLLRQRLVIA